MASKRTKITKKTVDGLRPGEIAWDTDVSGFAVRCQRRDKVFCLKTRVGKRQRWFSIGKTGHPWTVDTARKEARAILGEIARDQDPATKRDAKAETEALAEVAERYLTIQTAKKKPATAKLYRDLIERLVLEYKAPGGKLGEFPITDIRRRHISSLHYELRSTPTTANRVIAVLSSLFSWCEGQDLREVGTNPATGIEKYAEQSRGRPLKDDEFSRIGTVLADLEAGGQETPYVIAAIRLLIFTGARRNEILSLKWEHVDFESATLQLPDSKTGKKDIHLSAPSLEILANLPRVADNPFVIVGAAEGRHLVNLRKPWLRICKLVGLEGVRIHDLRHSFATVAVGSNASLPIVGKLLGHSKTATTEKYGKAQTDPVKAANETVGEEIAAKMRGASDKVVHLRSGGHRDD